MMIARYFSNDVRDAFINAFRLPNLFRRLFGEGALSVSFIPVFVDVMKGGGPESDKRARDLVAGVFSLLMAIVVTLSLLAVIFMPDILRLLLSGDAYMSVPGKFDLTVRLGRLMFCFLIFVSLYAFFMAIHNSLQKFALTALAPSLFNIAMIGAALASSRFAQTSDVLAYGVLLGGFLQMLILLPGVVKAGHFPRLAIPRGDDVYRVVRAFIPGMIGLSLMQLTVIVNMHFASRLPSGSQSYLYLADRILELPISLFAVSLGSALLPALARARGAAGALLSAGARGALGSGGRSVLGLDGEAASLLNQALRLILFVAIPSAVGMFVLARPIVDVLFLGREFHYSDAVSTAQVIQVYAFIVIVAGGVRILAQGFYAVRNTWFPALASGVALIAHVIFAFALTRAFGLNGLAAASLCSATVNLLMLATAYTKWVGPVDWRGLSVAAGKFLLCGLVMLAVLLTHDWILSIFGTRFWARASVLGAVILIGGAAYLAMARALRVGELGELLRRRG